MCSTEIIPNPGHAFGTLTARVARLATSLLACAVAASAPAAPPTNVPVVPQPTIPPQTIAQSVAAKEVLAGGQSLGMYNVGPLTAQPVALTSRGMLTAAQFQFWSRWRQAIADGRIQVQDVTIIARAADGHEVQRWTLQRAWPESFKTMDMVQGPITSVSLAYASVVSSL